MPNKNIIALKQQILTALMGRIPTHIELLETAQSYRSALQILLPVSDDEFSQIVRDIEGQIPVRMGVGQILTDRRKNYSPWYGNRRATITPTFWERFRQYLFIEKGWSAGVIDPIDEISNTIVGQLGDPESTQPFKRKGLVIGDVQSGKTVNFTAICNKAVDAGYRIVIILAGITEDLRKQTHRRFDKEFAGIDSQVIEQDELTDELYGVGCFGQAEVVFFTTVNQEFNANAKRVNNVSLNALKDKIPVFCVVKKNVRILKNLLSWLRNHPGNLGPDQRIDLPLLIIDDESDNAGINVNNDDENPTNTNRYIREIIALFNKVSYLAVTATPFANIFINPETENDMLEDDLFPRDFIYVLSPPTSDQPLRNYFAYMGASQIFGDNSFDGIIKPLEDLETALPAKHKSDSTFSRMPESLKKSIAYFCLANVIRDLRGNATDHRSMLIHISHLKLIHERIHQEVLKFFNSLKYAAQNYGSDPIVASQSPEIIFMKGVWEEYFSESEDANWEIVLPLIYGSIAPIDIRVVNSEGGSLDYDQHKQHGLRIIAIGGNCLSRGLTLEGLMVSYFRRTTKMYDTLLQMGRWFGYRPNYADLCKIWITEEATEWFEAITESYIELKNDVRTMISQGLSPKDFGMKVRTHPGALLPTARNKMRSAKTLSIPVSIAGRLLETPRVLLEAVGHNEGVMRSFVSKLDSIGQIDKGQSVSYFWKGVPAEDVADFVRSFRTDPWNLMFRGPDIAEYIDRLDEKWDVAIMEGEGDTYTFATEDGKSISIPAEQRKVEIENREVDNRSEHVIKISGKKVRVGAGGAAKVGLSQSQITGVKNRYEEAKKNNPELGDAIPDNWYFAVEVERKPILMLHVVQRRDNNDFIFAIGVGIPGRRDSVEKTMATYRVNLVEWRRRQETMQDEDPNDQDNE